MSLCMSCQADSGRCCHRKGHAAGVAAERARVVALVDRCIAKSRASGQALVAEAFEVLRGYIEAGDHAQGEEG